MRNLVCSVAICLIACMHVNAAEKYSDKEGFSYDIPPGWQLVPGADAYKISVAAAVKGLNPNINISMVIGREFDMKKFVLDVWGNMERASPKAKKTSEGEFKAGGNLKCTKISLTDEMSGKKVRQFCYLFTGNEKSITVLCTCADADDTTEATFDAAMKTFAITK